MTHYECEGCGLMAFDLPDDVDPDIIFERDESGLMFCQGCQQIPPSARLSEW